MPACVVAGALAAAAVAAPPAAAKPQASFEISDPEPLSGEPVTLVSTAETTGETAIAAQTWDLDDDGEFDDASGAAVIVSFAEPGTHELALLVTDAKGDADVAKQSIDVGNRPPTASIAYTPSSPRPQERITFTSTSRDPEGSVTTAWDLDDDGAYDDGEGRTATRAYPAGTHTVGLRVTDANGARDTASVSVRVAAATQSAPASAGAAPTLGPPGSAPVIPSGEQNAFLQPFPVIRIQGRAWRGGTRITLMTITAPADSVVTLRCSGRGCPYARSGPWRLGERARGRTVRIRGFARRLLRPGAKVTVRVSHPRLIGKYASFTIRKRRPPLRRDRCLRPPNAAIVRC